MNIKTKEKAIELRKNKWSLTRICEHLNAPKSSVYGWIKDIECEGEIIGLKGPTKKVDRDLNPIPIQILEDLIKKHMSISDMSSHTKWSKGKIRNHIVKYGLLDKYKESHSHGRNNKRNGCISKGFCYVCSKKTERGRWLCGGCQTKVKRYRTKLAAIKYKGGKCNKCGWSGHYAGFDFHHINPKEKEFSITEMSMKSWSDCKKELDKCEILCAICHRIEHTKSSKDEKLIHAINNYKGEILDFDPINDSRGEIIEQNIYGEVAENRLASV